MLYFLLQVLVELGLVGLVVLVVVVVVVEGYYRILR
jgi:hypothetical protein